MIKDQINTLWNNSGHNSPDTIKHIKSMMHFGFDESYDGSLCVFYFKCCVVVVSDSGLSIIEKAVK